MEVRGCEADFRPEKGRRDSGCRSAWKREMFMANCQEISAELQIRCDSNFLFLGAPAKHAQRLSQFTAQGHVCWLCQSAMRLKHLVKGDRLCPVHEKHNKENHTVEATAPGEDWAGDCRTGEEVEPDPIMGDLVKRTWSTSATRSGWS